MNWTTEDETLFTVVVYLVASARDCVDEPAIYGPFRMLEGASRLIQAGGEDTFLADLRSEIDAKRNLIMSDREEFVQALDELLRSVAAETKRRNLNAAAGDDAPRSGEDFCPPLAAFDSV